MEHYNRIIKKNNVHFNKIPFNLSSNIKNGYNSPVFHLLAAKSAVKKIIILEDKMAKEDCIEMQGTILETFIQTPCFALS